jgi:hypothetical protein
MDVIVEIVMIQSTRGSSLSESYYGMQRVENQKWLIPASILEIVFIKMARI